MKAVIGFFRIAWRLCLAGLGIALAGPEVYDALVLRYIEDWFVSIAVTVIGVAMIYPLFRYLIRMIRTWKAELRDESYVALFKTKTDELKKAVLENGHYEVKEDFSDEERLISQFRKDYDHFFHVQGKGVHENTVLQNTTTQLYWNILSLQKRRLDKKNITMSMEAQRMCYGKDALPVSGETVFDGKYEIACLSEMINAVRAFFSNGKRIACFRSKEVARYRILDTKKNDKGMIICPCCGSMSSRENLIDGCDFCGTKFTIEDLGMRVSDFGLYPDAAVEYKKYKDRRSRYAVRIGMLVTALCISYTLGDICNELFLHPDELYDGFTVFGAELFLGVILILVLVPTAELLFFTTLFPVLQTKASITYMGKKALHGLQNTEKHNQEAEEKIREHDPLFSLGGFYSNVQNKLAVLHYAENSRQMDTFGEGSKFRDEVSRLPEYYKDVIHMDVVSMTLNRYHMEEDLQKVEVTAQLALLEAGKHTIRKRKEKVLIRLMKDKNCLTQAVSGPELLICRKCGHSLTLLDGSRCEYCGNERHLLKYDWAIEDYQIL